MAKCVKTGFDPTVVTIRELMDCFFEIIDPYSLNKQGEDVGEKYRTGVYSEKLEHLKEAKAYLLREMIMIVSLLKYYRLRTM